MNHDLKNACDWYKQKKTEIHLGLYDGFIKSGIGVIRAENDRRKSKKY